MKEEEIIANLSHSYCNKILNQIKPFLKYNIKEVVQSTALVETNKVDSEFLERLILILCLNTSDISIPSLRLDVVNCPKGDWVTNFSEVGRRVPSDRRSDVANRPKGDWVFEQKTVFSKDEWLSDIIPFNVKSKQGEVMTAMILKKFKVVVKKSKSSRFDEITLRDFCVGIYLNKIIDEAPFFVKTLGSFNHNNQFHIITEYMEGTSLKMFIQNKEHDFTDFLNIFFQLLLGLEIAQNKLNFSHYDLHTDNVILVPVNHSFNISLYGYSYTIKYDYKPVMIDFGLSSIHIKGQTLGQKKLETKGIYDRISPGYDIYVFLLFCLDVSRSCSNLAIFRGIIDLLVFFKIKTKVSMNLLTNDHLKSLEKGVSNLIPNQFLQYLITNYSHLLNVEINNKVVRSIGKRPIFLKLKEVFDHKDELKLIHLNSKKGFIKTLVDNIKTYYWFKEKHNLTIEEIKLLINIDIENLENINHDLNINFNHDDLNITVEQKNIFFYALKQYSIIEELELHYQYPEYQKWINDFMETFVYKNITTRLNTILYKERIQRTI
jgi:serine/threonine protein kinase